MATLIFLSAVLLVLGIAGGFVIGLRAAPERLRPATLLWLSAFYLGLAVILIREGDPALEGEAAARNAPFAFVLYGILFGAPWVGGTFAGRAIGRALADKRG